MRHALALAAVFAALLVPPTASAAPVRECGNYGDKGNGQTGWTYGKVYGAGIFNVTGRRVWCTTARRVARRAYRRYPGRGRKWRYGKWTCRILASRHEYSDTRCTKRGMHIVHWQARS